MKGINIKFYLCKDSLEKKKHIINNSYVFIVKKQLVIGTNTKCYFGTDKAKLFL